MTELAYLRVLIVDDSLAMRRSVGMLLRAMKAQTVEAADGVEALSLLRVAEYDLVLTDINMPSLNGFGLLQAIKADDSLKHVPVLMMTLDPRTEDRALALEYGAAGLIAKPFTRAELEGVIRQALESRAATA